MSGENFNSGGESWSSTTTTEFNEVAAEDYTRGVYESLPASTTNLETEYVTQDYSDVETEDSSLVEQSGELGNYIIHQFKNYAGTYDSCTVTLVGQSNLATSVSAVYLQVYNQDSTTWETLDTDSTTDADTSFTLSHMLSNLDNYKDSNMIITCRVYQGPIE